ncbi:MAG: hypothetical protein COY09_02945 [Candidatus Portnoybacteria bacterium CG_4_10_14_0_2_um_filter_39_11]|uniref:Uncharacterized protein n=1 Tax=Candidatus Portnoybacteria bacterium CG_4_10_14_0_2_um_filter_39_11 TaxID=1974797 RepID=A0A2M7UGX3_9BACT|nr:MAG: hypothetical protein COY09_02945 [Candidatus Portnoybacteria bacterium CG_4_10_14_0_2_um_filter_39_11]
MNIVDADAWPQRRMIMEKHRRRRVIKYVGLPKLYLETVDYRLTVHPYGPQYDEAVGRIYQLSQASGPDLSEAKIAYVKSIKLVIPDTFYQHPEVGEVMPIKVRYQCRQGDEVVLLAKVDYDRYENMPDLKNRGGNWFMLKLYFESASRIVLD